MTKPKTALENTQTEIGSNFIDQLLDRYEAGMAAKRLLNKQMRAIKTVIESNGFNPDEMLKERAKAREEAKKNASNENSGDAN